jgi:hypothetical protein
MAGRRLVPILALVILALVTAACDDTGYSSPAAYITSTPRPPSARVLAAQETAQAEETTAALESVAKATADALELERRATQQALNLQGTQQAQEVNATRQAWEFAQTQKAVDVQATATVEARRATATRQALDATATAESVQATATAQAWVAQVQGTQAAAEAFAVEATRQAIERQAERERVTQPLRAWWVWALLALAIPAMTWLGWRFAKVVEDRARVVRRKADEGEPVVILDRERLALPMRAFNPYLNLTRGQEKAPLLAPTVESQEAATMRQQASNAIQARQVAATVKARNEHKSKAPHVVASTARALPRPAQQRWRQVPGLTKVVVVPSLDDAARQGILPPRLVETIEGQWHETDSEED